MNTEEKDATIFNGIILEVRAEFDHKISKDDRDKIHAVAISHFQVLRDRTKMNLCCLVNPWRKWDLCRHHLEQLWRTAYRAAIVAVIPVLIR